MLFFPLLWALSAEAAQHQSPLLGFSDRHQLESYEHIAVIGAGIGGASVAFELHERSRNLPSTQKVTIFEREGEVGGRIKSSYLYPNRGARKWIEEGATHFYPGDGCVNSAMDNSGLKPVSWPASWGTAHWRDDDVRQEITCNAESTAWKDRLYGIWRYGLSWNVLHAVVQSTLDSWDRFAAPSSYPITSITQALAQAGLSSPVYGPATAYLQNLSVSPALRDGFIQPCTRARVSQHLSTASGLSALLAAGNPATVSIDGGNTRLVEQMIQLSEADLQSNTLVTAISPGYTKRYKLSISQYTSLESPRDDVEFDTIILAAPLQDAELDLSRLGLPPTVLSSLGIGTHVTHFSSPVAISTNLSSLPLDISFKGELTLTTSNTTGATHVLHLRRSSACFKRYECHDLDECDQCEDDTFLFRIHSESYLADKELVQMIGQEWEEGASLDDYGIHYVRRQAWLYSYPQGGKTFVDEVEIAPNFWYLNGAESVMSSMEMSCRMGRNVAMQVHWRRH